MTIERVLSTLRDVDGVHGSCLMADDGIMARDLPSVFSDDLLEDVSPRLQRLRETFGTLDEDGGDLSHAVLRYSDYKVYLRPVGDGLLCVLAAANVNMPAMKMAGNLVAKRLAKHTGAASSQRPSSGFVTPMPPSAGARHSVPPPPPSAPVEPTTAPPPASMPNPRHQMPRTVPSAQLQQPADAEATANKRPTVPATPKKSAVPGAQTRSDKKGRKVTFRGRTYEV